MFHQRFKTLDQRFEEKYHREGGCLVWNTGKPGEYPKFWVCGSYKRASHFVWERAGKGHVPADRELCHTCDNPKCVELAHLFVGTHQENMRDRATKRRGNHPTGERNGRARITRHTAQLIRDRYAAGGISQQKLADHFGISQAVVSSIVRGVIWQERKS